jgi:hypothetical protein
MMAITYLFQQEDVPIKPYCINLDRPCKQKDCIAWYSLGNGLGRCLLVPGIEKEKSED